MKTILIIAIIASMCFGTWIEYMGSRGTIMYALAIMFYLFKIDNNI